MTKFSSKEGLAFCLLLMPLVTAAQITWLSGELLDLGSIPRKTLTEAHYVLRNDGEQPLRVETIRTSCGCTVPVWDQLPVLPGDTLVIPVEWRPRKRGRAIQKLDVFFYGVRQPVKLSLTAEVK